MHELKWVDELAFRDDVLAYLRVEHDAVRDDIASHDALSREDRENEGLLIRDAVLANQDGLRARYETPVNLTKLRPGDEVSVVDVATGSVCLAIVDSNDIESLSLTFNEHTQFPFVADIVVRELNTIDGIIRLVSLYRLGSPGLKYLKILAGVDSPRMNGIGAIRDLRNDEIPATFNSMQRAAVEMAVRRPNVCYVQGTPGSGKTHLLSVIAKIFSDRGMDVVVMALTHQAVNNALNKIAAVGDGVPVAKIGKQFKNIGLDARVVQAEGFSEYLAYRRCHGGFIGASGNVVGMTFQSALVNLGARKSPLMPQVILFDEAGQLPLTHSTAIGAFGCGSVVFVGDDAQMPPIYHEKLSKAVLSKSLFEWIKRSCSSSGVVLNVTYRMNSEITEYVGSRYYSPNGVDLISDPCSLGNRIKQTDPEWIHGCLNSVEYVECDCPGATDENSVEALAAVDRVFELHNRGLEFSRMAVITPYRRQVRLIMHLMRERFGNIDGLPLVDTVERLQGRDVDVIIVSLVVNNVQYLSQQQHFLLNKNRLNVMFSRATSRVIILASSSVRTLLGSTGAPSVV